jgi:acetyl esterase/lipase
VKHLRSALMLGLLLSGTGCTQLAFMAANLPTRFGGMTVVHDQPYGADASQKLDIYVPAHAPDERLDVVVFFYGGRWTSGAKADYRFVAAAFADRHFITVIPDYRKYPQVRFPVFVEDGAKALAWVSDNIAAHNGNPARIHVAGHSAGAHIGALLAADAHYLAAEGKSRSAVIHDFAGLAGPYAFTPDEPDLEDMFGPPANYPKMQVPTFIDGAQPPLLLLHGATDVTVKAINAERVAARAKTAGGCVRTMSYPGVDHIGIISALSWFNPKHVPVADDVARFFRSSDGAACRTAS